MALPRVDFCPIGPKSAFSDVLRADRVRGDMTRIVSHRTARFVSSPGECGCCELRRADRVSGPWPAETCQLSSSSPCSWLPRFFASSSTWSSMRSLI